MMGIFENIGIHTRVLSAAVLLISATTLTLGYLGVNLISQFVTTRFHQRIEFMVEHLAVNCELGILIQEPSLLQGLADHILKEDDVKGVVIADQDDNILVKAERPLDGPFRTVEKKVLAVEETYDFNAGEIAGSLPVPGMDAGEKSPGHQGREIGRIRVMYSVQGIDLLVEHMKRRFIYFATCLTLGACVIFHYISRSLVAPIVSLAHTARKVSRGQRDVRAAPGSTPEIANLALAFNNMLDSLAQGRKNLVKAYEKVSRQEAMAQMGRFSMMIAHEVKNPLGIIKASLEMMKSDMDIPGDNIPMSYAEDEIVRLNALIESFLMFSRPAKASFSIVDLNQMLDQVVTGFDLKHSSEDIMFDCRVPAAPFPAEADFDLVSRALSNIIANAADANQGQGVVLIRVKEIFTRNSGRPQKWTVSITDQGPGISEEDRKKIFDPFFTTKAKGTGLGLAFADHVIKAHGGRVQVMDGETGGTCFKVALFPGMIESKEEECV